MTSLQRLAYKFFPGSFRERPKGLFDNRYLLYKQIIKLLSGTSIVKVAVTDKDELKDHCAFKYPEGFYWRPTSVESIRRNFFMYILNTSDPRPKMVAVEYDETGVVAAYDVYYQRAPRLPGFKLTLQETPSLSNEQWSEYFDGAFRYEIARLHTVL